MACCHYLISGRVQGVGFRNFTSKRAREYGVRGWVRNLRDGRVEVLAEGADEDLRRLEVALAEGPLFGKVTDVKKSNVVSSRALDAFNVIADGESVWLAD